ncbi:MAG TPA: rhomboid family intramembrane serine protease [Acidimicrobiia bacterium]|jgi:membrane associated rhomboid family serine protease|nr:rhomboid family intramembrane serine protease [Acidimicrobiia bacterium]
MLPIRDVNPTRISPWVTLLVIASCLVVFFGIQNRGDIVEQNEFLFRRAAISCEVRTGTPLSPTEITSGVCTDDAEQPVFPQKEPWVSVFTSMFLHGGVGHVLFNMWFLWIFGNNVEEAFGHMRYILLYVIGGIVATLAFVVVNPDSTVPLVGASGAIAAVLGAYGVLFPAHRVLSLVGWFFIPIPAALFLGFWFFAQFGLGGTNTAWEAHVGGFLFGLVVSLVFRRSLLRRVAIAV